ncbi:MAG: sigma factor-like helix-turn-helix DNA-binding protein [Phycisphaerae bacterium]
MRKKPIPDEELLAIGYRLAERHGGQEADTDDAAQDFCLGVLERRARGGAAENPGGYEYVAGHSEQRRGERKRWRARNRTSQLNGHDRSMADADPLASLCQGEAAAAVREALADLTELERAVLVLRFGLDGGPTRSQTEVAQLVHRSPQRAGQIERLALRSLRRALGCRR